MEAFTQLARARTFTQVGPSALPVVEITAYCDLMCIRDPHERQEMLLFIRALDDCYLTHWHEKHKQK